MLFFVFYGLDIGFKHSFLVVEIFVLFQELVGNLERDLFLQVGE